MPLKHPGVGSSPTGRTNTQQKEHNDYSLLEAWKLF